MRVVVQLVRRTFERALRPMGYEVVSVGDAHLAYEMLEAAEHDLVLLDVHLPGLAGDALYLALVRRWPRLTGRVVMMTGDPGVLERDWPPELRSCPVLLKPFGLEALQRPLAMLLLAHQHPLVRLRGVRLLHTRSAPEDSDLWIQALRDPSVDVRTLAAQSMERVPTPATIKALVAALDDPHPDVRSAALGSLDAIQKLEDLKARWRDKVK